MNQQVKQIKQYCDAEIANKDSSNWDEKLVVITLENVLDKIKSLPELPDLRIEMLQTLKEEIDNSELIIFKGDEYISLDDIKAIYTFFEQQINQSNTPNP